MILSSACLGRAGSSQIEAEAKHIAGQGAYLESAAVARKTNAEAAAKKSDVGTAGRLVHRIIAPIHAACIQATVVYASHASLDKVSTKQRE